ncbi:plasmid stabilization system protein ParE [Flavobacterium sp. PL11]|jgi:plasmid stabilization system protein ParE|uniref:type II toxin-antitoxin system RelE/ParE family toxin n=1 Tax=Flavobacterium sp. PL11 TaxID=3071717 RepID=UPI002E04316B|nr:plasmid stabilization system protein ParE [Flavobacterium sp. PL11]
MVNKRVIIWDKKAVEHLKEAYNSFKTDDNSSLALKFKSTILKTKTDLLINPEIYEQDRFKYENNGSYKAFEKFHYQSVYRITQT